MATDSKGVPLKYYESPNSLKDIGGEVYSGLMAIGILASLSLLFTSGLLAFITWRMINWKSHYTSAVSRNQFILLIYQLLLADFLQSLGFLISLHWVAERQIVGPSGTCFAQGWLIQIGDVASGFFVLTIALHTTYHVILSKTLSYRTFLFCVIGIWGFALCLTALVPIIAGRWVFQTAGNWCWISAEHEGLRLFLHYIWIFIAQFGSIAIYSAGFYYLYRANHPDAVFTRGATAEALRRARMAMLAYALVYTVLSLPLAAGRMAAMSHNAPSDAYYLFSGALFTSSGWIDSLLYTFTRRTLLFDELNLHDRPRNTNLGGSNLRGNDSGFPRHSSTDSILADTGFRASGGIKLDKTVKVEMGDLESQSTDRDPKGYYAMAEANKQ
ncbi:G protein-coupled glucose receptor regulating Gpa2-domain-containing protein [Xylariaceae sp. FL0662B]|nr:G protein-coupled glucose receptor regulating Gpa2-domain-containing protein [Xylariaceae sp. FL0662B]